MRINFPHISGRTKFLLLVSIYIIIVLYTYALKACNNKRAPIKSAKIPDNSHTIIDSAILMALTSEEDSTSILMTDGHRISRYFVGKAIYDPFRDDGALEAVCQMKGTRPTTFDFRRKNQPATIIFDKQLILNNKITRYGNIKKSGAKKNRNR